VDANGEIMGIDDSDSDSSDDSPKKKRPPVPIWAQSPNLRQQLFQQQRIDPDSIFSDLVSPNLKGIFLFIKKLWELTNGSQYTKCR
jgi:hypothetical protein